MDILLFNTCMLPFWNPQDIRKPLRGHSKLPDHHQEDQEAQGCRPGRIKEFKCKLVFCICSVFLFAQIYLYIFFLFLFVHLPSVWMTNTSILVYEGHY